MKGIEKEVEEIKHLEKGLKKSNKSGKWEIAGIILCIIVLYFIILYILTGKPQL
jgi:hypothetical protein